MDEFNKNAIASVGPIAISPRSPNYDSSPIHGLFYTADNAYSVSSEGTGPEGGLFRFLETGSLTLVSTLETGWRFFISFQSDKKMDFRWSSFMFGDDDGEEGVAQFDTALDRYYFVTPAVSGSIPEGSPPSVVTIRAGSAAADWSISGLQLSAIS